MISRIAFMLNAMIVLVLIALSGCASSGDETSGASASGTVIGNGGRNVALGSAGQDDDADDDDDDDDDDSEEEEIPLSEVPDAVKTAAAGAVPGIVLEEAEREVENGNTVYCVEGEADGVEYEVEVSADGQVIEVESEGDEDDDD